jgi:hypothetical protein
MLVGFDVYHGKGSKGASIGALVATASPTYARYFSTTSFHKDSAELANNLTVDMPSKSGTGVCSSYFKIVF